MLIGKGVGVAVAVGGRVGVMVAAGGGAAVEVGWGSGAGNPGSGLVAAVGLIAGSATAAHPDNSAITAMASAAAGKGMRRV
jgi:hypothetical protein